MIVYSSTKSKFRQDVRDNRIEQLRTIGDVVDYVD